MPVVRDQPRGSDGEGLQGAPALSELLEALELRPLEDDTLVGPVLARNLPKTFGGLILAQAVCAAAGTIDSVRRLHSFHAYFLKAGDPTSPLRFRVQAVREGSAFTTQEVSGEQAGRRVFAMMASFHVAEGGFEHELRMDDRPSPAESSPITGWEPHAGVQLPEWWTTDGPIDVRFESRPVGLVGGRASPPQLRLWLRPADRRCLDPAQTQALLAFASDLSLLDVALQPLGRSWFAADAIRGASLDHAMWLHRSLTWSDWVRYDISSSISAEGRALVRGEMRTVDGRLIATVVQEGLLRAP